MITNKRKYQNLAKIIAANAAKRLCRDFTEEYSEGRTFSISPNAAEKQFAKYFERAIKRGRRVVKES